MNDKLKGSLRLLVCALVIGFLVFSGLYGFGKNASLAAKSIKQGLDLAGGVSITYQTVKDDPSAEEMADVQYKLQMRADVYSTESAVYLEGSNRVTVEIPGVSDAEAILAELGNPGALFFIYGDGNITSVGTNSYVLSRTMEEIEQAGGVVLNGADVKDAKAGKQQLTQTSPVENVVELYFTEEGSAKFAEATAKCIGRQIAIVYDNKVISAPRVNSKIDQGQAVITGQKTFDEADILASIIRIGALPTELMEIRSNVVGAQLGAEALNTSLLAAVIGFAVLILFMCIYYRVPGVSASISLIIYMGLMILMLNAFNVTLTLQGIAGIILSVGMAVDANVIIFQRIREELAKGMTVRSSMKNGFKKALSAIIDGNVTTLIAAVVLYLVGTGGVKGFATTLGIGIILSMFTALFVTRFVLAGLYEVGFDNEKFYGIQKERKVINFMKFGPKAGIISGTVILIGIVSMVVFGISSGNALNYGLDFSGGTSFSVTFPDSVTEELNRPLEEIVSSSINKTGEIVNVTGENTYIIKTEELSQDERAALTKALVDKYNVDEKLITVENISGRVSAEMRADAIKAVVIATICMLLYIWIRFKNFNFASSAVLALIHDVLVVTTLYAVARISVGNNFIACMLTIVGYSINATIVIFDRIRENMAEKRKNDTVADVVNKSITETLSRSINTSLTTFIMVLALVIFGVDSIREFAIPLMAGIIVGAYSSVCLTGFVWYFMETKVNKHVEEEEDKRP
ncbi:MAG: protein translocase subunit SecD [Lachnospiraceae bacterium]|nr:protein translocase subunit SecD [Lachnospiraceae bacterium]